MSNDLVKRLRDPAFGTETTERNLMNSAADRIEELCVLHREYEKILTERIQQLEAKLSKAVEALFVIDALDPEGLIEGCSQSALRGLVLRMGAIARTTLAELKGEDRG